MSVDIKIPALGGIPYADLDTDTTLAGNSDTRIPTQKAVKAYADAIGSASSGASIPLTALSTDGTLAGNSDTEVPSEKAVRTFVTTILDGMLGPDGFVLDASEVTASGEIPAVSFVQLNQAESILAMTITTGTAGHFLIITQTDAGTHGHTVTLGACTYDGSNKTATFNATGETLVLFGVTSTRYAIVANIGEVAISA